MDLAQLTERLGGRERRTVDVDIGRHLEPPFEDGEAVLTLREPTTTAFYAAAETAEPWRRKAHPEFTRQQAFTVQLLARCHTSPVFTTDAELLGFYAKAASENPPLFLHLVTTLHGEFPWLMSLGAEAENRLGE